MIACIIWALIFFFGWEIFGEDFIESFIPEHLTLVRFIGLLLFLVSLFLINQYV